ncbi:unnamed protein product [Victoria cruziana]
MARHVLFGGWLGLVGHGGRVFSMCGLPLPAVHGVHVTYSNENFEGRRGERFHVNGTCTWPAHPGNSSVGGRVQRLEEHRTSRGVRSTLGDLENPEDRVPPTPGHTHNRIKSPR